MDVGRAADVNKGEGEKGGVNVANRHDIQTNVMLVKAEIRGIDEIKCDVGFMGANHPFGFAGGAGGVDQNPGVRGRDLGFGFTIVAFSINAS